MSKWYVKELSKITGLTVQTLHHYDHINLLKPSIRQANGYRLYSEADLMKVEQIMALKSFGFELSQIKMILSKEGTPMDHIKVQAQLLEEKAKDLLNASKVMNTIVTEHRHQKSIPWKKTIELIEVYKMSKQLEEKWAADVLSPEELKDYVRFEDSLKERFSDDEKKAFEKEWKEFEQEIQANLTQDPKSDYGYKMGERGIKFTEILYPPEFVGIRRAIWEKGFQKGYGDIPQEVVQWLDQAIDTYWRRRIYAILETVDQEGMDTETDWEAIMTEMFGTSKEQRLGVVEAAMTDPKVSEQARKWLKSHYNL